MVNEFMEKKLLQLLMDIFKIHLGEAENASMQSISGWDSLSHVELMMSIEEEFNISQIVPEEIVFMTSIDNIKQILKNKGVEI